VSFPQSGFKPWRLPITLTLPPEPSGVKRQVRMLPSLWSLVRPSSRLSPPACTGGFVLPPSLRLCMRPPRPTGPWLRVGYVVPPLCATMTWSAALSRSSGFPRATGYTWGLCPTTWSGLPGRASLL